MSLRIVPYGLVCIRPAAPDAWPGLASRRMVPCRWLGAPGCRRSLAGRAMDGDVSELLFGRLAEVLSEGRTARGNETTGWGGEDRPCGARTYAARPT
jgi:hypothetical protein